MAGHPGDLIHRRSGGSNSEAQWRVTLRITFIGDLEGFAQSRYGGSLRGITWIGAMEAETQRRHGCSLLRCPFIWRYFLAEVKIFRGAMAKNHCGLIIIGDFDRYSEVHFLLSPWGLHPQCDLEVLRS